MDNSSPILWAKHLIKAAVEYFNERKVRTCILVDNAVLKDGVLTAMSAERSDFIICVAPGYVTQMEYGDTELDITVKFNGMWHAMSIPYEAIVMVLCVGVKGVLTEEGHLNMISVPPVVYPTNAKATRQKAEQQRIVDETQKVEEQPAQEALQVDINVHLFNRRRSDTGTR